MSYSLFADLTESKLIPSYWHVSNYTADQIGDIVYLYLMGLYILSVDPSTSKWAGDYARKTLANGPFTQKLNTANDLYVMLFALKGGVGFKDKIRSSKYLGKIRIDWRKLHDFLYDLANGLPRNHRAFLLNLDAGLNIMDGDLKAIRREVMDWSSMDHDSRMAVVTRLLSKLHMVAGKGEIFPELQKHARTPEIKPEVNTGTLTGLFKGLI
jgi:hypothetical protein